MARQSKLGKTLCLYKPLMFEEPLWEKSLSMKMHCQLEIDQQECFSIKHILCSAAEPKQTFITCYEAGCWYIGCSLYARHICSKRDAGNYQNSVDVKTSVDWRKIHQILCRQDLKKENRQSYRNISWPQWLYWQWNKQWCFNYVYDVLNGDLWIEQRSNINILLFCNFYTRKIFRIFIYCGISIIN